MLVLVWLLLLATLLPGQDTHLKSFLSAIGEPLARLAHPTNPYHDATWQWERRGEADYVIMSLHATDILTSDRIQTQIGLVFQDRDLVHFEIIYDGDYFGRLGTFQTSGLVINQLIESISEHYAAGSNSWLEQAAWTLFGQAASSCSGPQLAQLCVRQLYSLW